ncbi:MAG TPA: hypothetical protein VFK10_15575 [Burkholderiaceae bacterium]|nr:hypothetical protein [Burkholderiaceae bacterium]
MLLVEDNDEVAAGTQSVLESMGCTVSRRINADNALRTLGGHSNAADSSRGQAGRPACGAK